MEASTEQTAPRTDASVLFERAGGFVDGLSPRRLWLLVFVVMAAIYLPTATWDMRTHVDAAMSAFPAYTLVHDGTLDLSGVEDLVLRNEVASGQTVEVDGRRYSNRNPGTIFLTVPAYAVERLVLGDVPFRTGPAAATAALVTAAAVATMALVIRELGTNREAMVAAMIVGLGTPTWSVSADSTWAHGPNQLWLAIGLYFMARAAYTRSGLALGAAVFTRPYSAVVAAVSGVYLSLKTRDWRPVVLIGITSALGAAAFLLYSKVVFEVASAYGGYAEQGYHERALTSAAADTYARDLFFAVFSPTRGFLLHTVFVIPLMLGLRTAWRAAPHWVRGAAFSGIAYLLLQIRASNFQGDFFFGYRFQLEALWLAIPLLFLAWREHVQGDRMLRMTFVALVIAAVVLQVLGAAVELYK